MTKETIEKLYSMLTSGDKEIRALGVVLARAHCPEVTAHRDSYGYNFESMLAEIERLVYKKSLEDLHKMRRLVEGMKHDAVRDQDFTKAVFYRNLEKSLATKILEYDQEANREDNKDG